ncbi:MAG TPA: hypothetical protein VMX36_06050 [Sedimentisphaerales bacterium]|nr:hypothetical protein [Sedimentisphaerales bacterium]
MSKKLTVLGLFFYLCMNVAVFAAGEQTAEPPRLKRSESFFGIHFDFHAGDDCKNIGQRIDREMVEEPFGRKVDYTYRQGKIHLTIPRLTFHEIIVVE